MNDKAFTAQDWNNLKGWQRHYREEGSIEDYTPISELGKRMGIVRRRIEDIKQASYLEEEILKEVWE